MATLLHLSDLHLTGRGKPVALADHKVSVVPVDAASTRKKLLMSSLHGLDEALRDADETLDAIIITGDITNGGVAEGHAELTEVLEALGASLPPRPRILVLPGNHDVDRDAKGDARIAGIRALRAEGYLVGWLSEAEVNSEPPPVLTATDRSFVLVGLNSSIYAGSMLNVERGLERHLDNLQRRAARDAAIKALLDAWNERGRADIARISDVELEAARPLLGAASDLGPLRIVGLHHQVLPVGTAEEIKPFEGILNLGHFRRWLVSNQVDLVLHGHKHNPAIVRDRIDSGGVHPTHELTILSAPSISTATGADAPFAQLIRVSPSLPRMSEYEVISVVSTEPGTSTALAEMPRRPRPLDELLASGVLSGATVDKTYARITAALPRLRELPTPLVCRIEDGASGVRLPEDMPDVPPTGEERDEWLASVIDWWQREEPGRAAAFNHGQFLSRRSRGRMSAGDRIVQELGKKPGSSRALALLVNQDTLADTRDFPSFISLQFVLQRDRLDAIAYFRKQEMPHWWPINVVEVAEIQRRVVDKMRGNIPLSCGSITTVTAMPVPGQGMPTVSVPDLDRRVDRPGGMLDLVLPLFNTTVNRSRVEELWEGEFSDWAPSEGKPADVDPRPLLGLRELAVTVEAAAQVHSENVRIAELVSRIENLHQTNANYVEEEREDWARRARKGVSSVKAALSAVLDERDK